MMLKHTLKLVFYPIGVLLVISAFVFLVVPHNSSLKMMAGISFVISGVMLSVLNYFVKKPRGGEPICELCEEIHRAGADNDDHHSE